MHFTGYILNFFIPVARAQETVSSSGSVNVIQLLGIDWKLFIAQLINFGIVLFVLWKWVFGPLGNKLQERSAKIEKSIKQAADIEKKHKEAESLIKDIMEKARAEAYAIIDKAQQSAALAKEQILFEAKNSAERLINQAQKQIDEQKEHLMSEVREEAAALVFLASEKVLRARLDSKTDQELVKESLKQL